ncbi:MAG: COQ9 family protein [Novosphingobium sp.]|uniref:COQ9 family protein n=1 Tax=Novosphingobium sp. TaxID=1874826 RepID=UPI003C79BD15
MENTSLDALRLDLAPRIAAAAAFDGWSEAAVRAAAGEAGTDPDAATYAFSGGAMAMISAYIGWVDQQMIAALPKDKLAAMKIRERIRAQVQARLDVMTPHKEALRRAQSIMAMPQNVGRTLKLGWHSADVMWRQAGDTATDYNHYTKRMTLGSIYAATLAVFVADSSEDGAETKAFLERRIDGIMQFEKAKARLLNRDVEQFSPARLLGRLRYPAR